MIPLNPEIKSKSRINRENEIHLLAHKAKIWKYCNLILASIA